MAELGERDSPDTIDRSNPFVALWCSAVRKGGVCANGFRMHGIACSPATVEQAKRFVPPCCNDDI